MRICAVVLAAGEGRRLGGPKALAMLGAQPVATAALRAFERPDVARRVLVLGAAAERIADTLDIRGETAVVVNGRWREGMLTSVQSGLDAADALGAEALLLHPVDNPLVAPETVGAVIQALAGGARIAVPSHAGRRGHPAGFARATWPALRALPPGEGARGLLAAHPEWIVHVAAGPDCLFDLDTPADLERALRALERPQANDA